MPWPGSMGPSCATLRMAGEALPPPNIPSSDHLFPSISPISRLCLTFKACSLQPFTRPSHVHCVSCCLFLLFMACPTMTVLPCRVLATLAAAHKHSEESWLDDAEERERRFEEECEFLLMETYTSLYKVQDLLPQVCSCCLPRHANRSVALDIPKLFPAHIEVRDPQHLMPIVVGIMGTDTSPPVHLASLPFACIATSQLLGELLSVPPGRRARRCTRATWGATSASCRACRGCSWGDASCRTPMCRSWRPASAGWPASYGRSTCPFSKVLMGCAPAPLAQQQLRRLTMHVGDSGFEQAVWTKRSHSCTFSEKRSKYVDGLKCPAAGRNLWAQGSVLHCKCPRNLRCTQAIPNPVVATASA